MRRPSKTRAAPMFTKQTCCRVTMLQLLCQPWARVIALAGLPVVRVITQGGPVVPAQPGGGAHPGRGVWPAQDAASVRVADMDLDALLSLTVPDHMDAKEQAVECALTAVMQACSTLTVDNPHLALLLASLLLISRLAKSTRAPATGPATSTSSSTKHHTTCLAPICLCAPRWCAK